jgi:FixJ family two-component response regulator
MTGYESKRAMAQDKLAQPAQEPTLQEQLATAQADWSKAHAARNKADADINRILKLMEKNNGT